MKKQVTQSIIIGLVALSVWNCKTSDPEPTPYGEGVYIINEGNFSENNGSISYLNRNSNIVATNVFVQANPTLAVAGGSGQGGLVEDYAEINGKGLVLVDNTVAGKDKVEIVEFGTFVSRATLKAPDIENPRRVIQVGPNKAYISCWDVSGSGSAFLKDPGYVAVVDLNTSTVSKKIPAVKGVEQMVMAGSEVFVGSVGFSGDKILLIIDANTDTVKEKIDFGATPIPIALDANGKLWIKAGKDMVRINPQTRLVEQRLTFASAPGAVVISADKKAFYYTLSGKTSRFSIDATSAIGTQVIARSFAALGIDPQTKQIYGSVIPSYTQAGYVLRFQEGGALIDSVKAEIAPSGFFFR